ncbi:MAG: hypothetical protein EXS30_05155 [Pedosphaera sp.]|nr:hypothetical protein [Pedosphaera sp.]
MSIIEIVDEYIKSKSAAFEAFIETCVKLKELTKSAPKEAEAFILDLLAPNRDARVFEIVLPQQNLWVPSGAKRMKAA